jgi:hypothetical protein
MSRLRRGLVRAVGVRAARVAADVAELHPFPAEPQFGEELPEQLRVLLGEPAPGQDQIQRQLGITAGCGVSQLYMNAVRGIVSLIRLAETLVP